MVRPRLRRTRTGTTAGTRAATAAIAMAIAAGAMMRIIWPDTVLTLTPDRARCPAERETEQIHLGSRRPPLRSRHLP